MFGVGAVRQTFAVQAINHQVQVAVNKGPGLVVDFGVALFNAIGLDENNALFNHGHGFVFGRQVGVGTSVAQRKGAGQSENDECELRHFRFLSVGKVRSTVRN